MSIDDTRLRRTLKRLSILSSIVYSSVAEQEMRELLEDTIQDIKNLDPALLSLMQRHYKVVVLDSLEQHYKSIQLGQTNLKDFSEWQSLHRALVAGIESVLKP